MFLLFVLLALYFGYLTFWIAKQSLVYPNGWAHRSITTILLSGAAAAISGMLTVVFALLGLSA